MKTTIFNIPYEYFADEKFVASVKCLFIKMYVYLNAKEKNLKRIRKIKRGLNRPLFIYHNL